jgi:DNA-binding phage protein
MPGMTRPQTGAERYLADRLSDPGYRAEYEVAERRIALVDLIAALDARRADLGLSKAELARRAGMKPEAIRRLFSVAQPNPTLSTFVALAGALGLELRPEASGSAAPARSSRSGGRRTRARTA